MYLEKLLKIAVVQHIKYRAKEKLLYIQMLSHIFDQINKKEIFSNQFFIYKK